MPPAEASHSTRRSSPTADAERVVVIGAGIVGASVSFHLADAGADVHVVDAQRTGRATAAAAGIVGRPWRGGTAAGTRLRHRAVDACPTIAARVGADVHVVGALHVGLDGPEFDEARQALEAVHGPVEVLTPEAARSAFPYLAPDLSAIHVATTIRVDGERFRRRLLDAARASGASSHVGDAAVHVRAGKVEGVRLDDRVLTSSCVVVAAGAWSARLLEPLGLSLAVSPQRGQIAHLGVHEATDRMPAVQPLGASHYLLPFDGGRVVVGATRETGSGFGSGTTAGGVSSVLADALHVAPGLADAELLEVRVGLRPSTPDGEPMLGPVPDCPGLWIATGTGRSGLLLGPYCGQLVASSIAGHRLEEELEPFAPLRAFR